MYDPQSDGDPPASPDLRHDVLINLPGVGVRKS
jgi:hypothetical protein